MAGGGIGNLVVRLALDAADFTSGLTRTEAQAKKSAQAIQDQLAGAANAAKTALAAVGVSLAADAFIGFIKGSIDAADRLSDLSNITGVAAVQIGALGYAAKLGGSDLESVAGGLGKLNKSIAASANGNQEAAQGFAALGVSVKDTNGQLKTADQVLLEVADKFATYEDGPNKAALAVRLFGKAGADLIPLLNQGSEAINKNVEFYKKYSGVTDDVVNKSGDFNDTLDKLHLLSGALGTTIAAELLPTLQSLADALLDSKTNGTAFTEAARAVGVAFRYIVLTGANVAYVFEQIGDSLASTAAQASTLTEAGGLQRAIAIGKEATARAVERRKAIDALNASLLLNGTLEQPRVAYTPYGEGGSTNTQTKAPGLPDLAAAAAAQKKILEGALKDLERQAGQEKDILDSRNKVLDLYNGENLISFQDYYAARTAAQQENLTATLALYDQEIAALKKSQAGASVADRTDAQTKINDLLDKKIKLTKDAAEATITDSFKEKKAYDDLAKSLRGVQEQLLELDGNDSKAASLRIGDQFKDISDRLAANGDTAGLEKVNSLKDALQAQADFNEAAKAGADIQTNLNNLETEAAAAAASGALSDLEYMSNVSAARKQAATDLQAIVDKQNAIAVASGNPALVLSAQSAQAALSKLRSESDLVAAKLDTVFQSAFGDAFADFITGTKSASDAFKAFGQSVIDQLAKIAAQQAASSLFSGAGGLFSGLFGGASAGGSSGGLIDSIYSSYGAAATGGSVGANSVTQVNERGPELLETGGKQFLMMGGQSGNIKTNSSITSAGSGGDMKLTIINNTTGRIDSVQQQQISPTERALIIQEAVSATASSISDPNSRMSRSLGRSTNVQRSR